jgi:diguanylate cyclase (GGDEF)-like protein/PAS domain S-box-containing protein
VNAERTTGFRHENDTSGSLGRRFHYIVPLLIAAVVVAAIAGGSTASYRVSQSALHTSRSAADAYNLRGDLLLVASYSEIPRRERSAVQKYASALAVGAVRQDIQKLRSDGGLSPLLRSGVAASALYVRTAADPVALAKPATNDGASATAGPAQSVTRLVDRAADATARSANQLAVDERISAIAMLLLVLSSLAFGLLWLSRLRRRQAVSASQDESLRQFEAMVENGSDLLLLTDINHRVIYCSPPAARFVGMSPDDVAKAPIQELVHPDDLGRVIDARLAMQANTVVEGFDMRFRHADGGWRTLEIVGNDLSTVFGAGAVAWHGRDVTDRRTLEDQLERQAFEDSLTGIANRALFQDRLRHALARGERTNAAVGVIMIDLDGFKAINDSMGHDAGDDALREIAARIARSARPSDTVARLGGDEFSVLLEGVDDKLSVEDVANRILDIIRRPLILHGASVLLSASIGTAVSKSQECTPETLLHDADTAMYVAKNSGRDRCASFEPVMRARVTDHVLFSQDLSRALERDEFVLHYQPSFDLENVKLEGAEALLRWQSSERGLVMPADFIPIAERHGLMVPIGRWVLEQACEQAVSWLRDSCVDSSFTMSVNVSGQQLNHESLIRDVRAVLANSGFSPEKLILEITESVFVTDADMVIARLRELKELGISIAIDDFGTGYSSLAYLRQFPIDILKIDKSFVDAASAGDPGGDAILRAILDLCTGLHLRTIAEGVEESSQARHVKELGCQSAQGYLYSVPMPPDELRARFASNTWGVEPVAT